MVASIKHFSPNAHANLGLAFLASYSVKEMLRSFLFRKSKKIKNRKADTPRSRYEIGSLLGREEIPHALNEEKFYVTEFGSYLLSLVLRCVSTAQILCDRAICRFFRT